MDYLMFYIPIAETMCHASFTFRRTFCFYSLILYPKTLLFDLVVMESKLDTVFLYDFTLIIDTFEAANFFF